MKMITGKKKFSNFCVLSLYCSKSGKKRNVNECIYNVVEGGGFVGWMVSMDKVVQCVACDGS